MREIGALPEIARCLAGLGRVAMDLGTAGQARRHLTRSIELSQAAGTRLGIARGMEAFAALAVRENLPERAVRLAGAAASLRQAAGLPVPTARTEAFLAPVRHLGEPAIARLWAQGLAMDTDAAVMLALESPEQAASASPTLTVVEAHREPAAMPPDEADAPP